MAPQGHCQFPIDIPAFPDSYITLPVDIAVTMFSQYDEMEGFKKLRETYNSVNLYVMAPRDENPDSLGNYWTSLPDWPTPTLTNWYLQTDGSLNTNPPQGNSGSQSYYYDPYLPVPTWGGNNLFNFCGPRDESCNSILCSINL